MFLMRVMICCLIVDSISVPGSGADPRHQPEPSDRPTGDFFRFSCKSVRCVYRGDHSDHLKCSSCVAHCDTLAYPAGW